MYEYPNGIELQGVKLIKGTKLNVQNYNFDDKKGAHWCGIKLSERMFWVKLPSTQEAKIARLRRKAKVIQLILIFKLRFVVSCMLCVVFL